MQATCQEVDRFGLADHSLSPGTRQRSSWSRRTCRQAARLRRAGQGRRRGNRKDCKTHRRGQGHRRRAAPRHAEGRACRGCCSRLRQDGACAGPLVARADAGLSRRAPRPTVAGGVHRSRRRSHRRDGVQAASHRRRTLRRHDARSRSLDHGLFEDQSGHDHPAGR